MIRENQTKLNQLNALSDAVLVFLSYLFASWLWLDVICGNAGNMANVSSLLDSSALAAAVYALWTVLLLHFFGVYAHTRIRSAAPERRGILLGNACALVSAAAALYLFRLVDFSRGVLALFYPASCLALGLKRLAVRRTLAYLRARGYNQKHVVVVGSGSLARRYAEAVERRPSLGIQVKMLVGPEGEEKNPSEVEGLLEAVLHGEGVDEVVIALEISEADLVAPVVSLCEKCGVKISVVPFYNDVIPTQPTVDHVGSLKLIQLRTTPLDEPLNAFCKRAVDLLGSLLLIALTSPLMLAAAVGTRLSSPGPVLFRQERVGLKRKTFTMYKFRSMRVNAAEQTGWSAQSDGRRTAFGSLLRKTSLDELPQLFNVLRGDMSLVGPRPELPYFVEQFRETVPLYMVKYQVRPGMTGWAQVNGLRGDTSIPDRIRHDLWYIENWSLGLDVRILLRTVLGGMINREKLS